MLKEVAPLIWHCFRKIAEMLKRSYWNRDSHIFDTFPSSLIDQLIVHVTDISTKIPLKCSDLQLLIASGRVSEFHLRSMLKANPHSIAEILRHLSSACEYLTNISITVNVCELRDYSIVIPDLNNLLSKAQNLEEVNSNLEFDVGILRDSPKLRILNIDFALKNQLYRLFSVDGQLRVNNSLQRLYIPEFESTLSVSEIVIILKYCSRLIYFDVNIAKALELLHAEEWKNGTLTHKYNIIFCELGCVREVASEIAVRIASKTCPRIETISLYVGSDNAISPLSSFRNIESLSLSWNPDSYGDYITGVQPLLENKIFGQNLTYLLLQFFRNTDISSISVCCPNLEKLCVMYCSSKCNSTDILPIRFPKLKYLDFEACDIGIIGTEKLIQLLSSAHDLRTIALRYDISFTDHILEKVLIQNSLSKLEYFTMRRCELSLNSVRMLASTARSLIYICILYSERPDEIRAAFSELNPEVYLNIRDETNSE